MPNDTTASAAPSTTDSALAPSPTPDSGAGNIADPMAALEGYFAAQQESSLEGDVDNPDDASGDDEASPYQPVINGGEEEDADADEGEAGDASDDAEADPTPAEGDEGAEASPEDATEANFDALSEEPEFLSAEEIKARFPRNSSKEIVEFAAEMSEAARVGHEVVTKLGGEPFVEPLATISEGLQAGDPEKISHGFIAAAGPEGFLEFLGSFVGFAVSAGPKMMENPETAEFGKAVYAIGNAALERRFGENITVEKLERLAHLDRVGWGDAIEEWQKDGWVDREKAAELLEAMDDPKLLAEREKNRELQNQLAEKTRQEAGEQAARDVESSGVFTKYVTDAIEKTLNEIVWATSPLRELAKDTPEVKAEKAYLRSRLSADAVEVFKADTATWNRLLTAFRYGHANTATFKKSLSDAIGQSALKTKEQTAITERMLARLYGNTRNAQLLKKRGNKVPGALRQPNPDYTPPQTQQRPDTKPKSSDEILENMTKRIAALG